MEQVLYKVGVYVKTKDKDKLVKVVARGLTENEAFRLAEKKNAAMGIKVDLDGCFSAKPGQKFTMVMD
jgi:hypothetical protein